MSKHGYVPVGDLPPLPERRIFDFLAPSSVRRRDTVSPARRLTAREEEEKRETERQAEPTFQDRIRGFSLSPIDFLANRLRQRAEADEDRHELNERREELANKRIETILAQQERETRLSQFKTTPLPPEVRRELELLDEQTAQEVTAIDEEIGELNERSEEARDIFSSGTQFLEAMGLPSTIDSIREDPEISAALDAMAKAVETGKGLEEALDQMGDLSPEERQDIGRTYGRKEWMAEIQGNIRTQIHNLIENRQQVEQSGAEMKDWLEIEADAQENPLFDSLTDASPSGRGFDTVMNIIEPWLEANFVGILSEEQEDLVIAALSNAWVTMPSAGEPVFDPATGEKLVDPETKKPIISETFTAIAAQNIRDIIEGRTDLGPSLGFPPEKVEAFIQEVAAAFEAGILIRDQADAWKTMTQFVPGDGPLVNAIYDVALDIYDDTEIASQISTSTFLHEIIEIRSGGNTVRDESKIGNQFGLGNLPEHTYKDMNYMNMQNMDANPELQLEALLHFIGLKYGFGYPGLQPAFSELLHNPDGWGELES